MALETLAWIEAARGNARRTAVLLGSAQALSRSTGTSAVLFPKLAVHHEDCEQAARQALGRRTFEKAYVEGTVLDLDAAIEYALGDRRERTTAHGPRPAAELTAREREVAGLIAEGLTNRTIAARLSISSRTAEGHVEHILTKLGFTSRAQIAVWITEHNHTA